MSTDAARRPLMSDRPCGTQQQTLVKFTVALTGGIGSGKSTVADLFKGHGVTVIDADVVSRALTAPGGAAIPEVAATFGQKVIAPDGGLDRAAVRRMVFAEPEKRRRLEAILHPRIRDEVQRRRDAATGPYCMIVIPLLIETGRQYRADRVLVVDVSESIQIARVEARSGLGRDEIQRIIASQATRGERRAAADDLIDNDGSPSELIPQVEALHRRYLSLAR